MAQARKHSTWSSEAVKMILHQAAPLSSLPQCQTNGDWRGRMSSFTSSAGRSPCGWQKPKAVDLVSGWYSLAGSCSPSRGAWRFSCIGVLIHWVGALDFNQHLILKSQPAR